MANLKNLNRFEFAPVSLDISRSRFHVPHTHKTTLNSGELIPIGLFEVLPSDTFSCDVSSVLRMITPVVPTMDNAFIDIYAFFVPNRIACAHPKDWEKICGENVNGFWAPPSESTLDNTGNMVNVSSMSVSSIGAYMGLPVTVNPYRTKVSALPLRGYVSIWNEWFRDQNTQPPLVVDYSSTSNSVLYNNSCLPVNKFHDYFTSCLPAPQKGQAVTLPIDGIAPVVLDLGQNALTPGSKALMAGVTDSTGVIAEDFVAFPTNGDSGSVSGSPRPADLYADLSSAAGATINQLRQAFAIQRMLEKDARGGSRYRELLRTHYGSNIPDNTIQIPQYLGGKRVPINITQVLQTSSTNDISPLGSTGAFSNTALSSDLFTKSFDEHGFIHVVACIRTNQTYSQGLSRMWTRNRRFDWYYPSFANLGEQAVLERELYIPSVGSDIKPDDVFGYQEAWAEYRYIPNRVSGLLIPDNSSDPLNFWTYTNYFTAPPVLNSDFMKQDPNQIGDTLVFTDANYQFIADFYFDMQITRAMPTYSIPGLIDHH